MEDAGPISTPGVGTKKNDPAEVIPPPGPGAGFLPQGQEHGDGLADLLRGFVDGHGQGADPRRVLLEEFPRGMRGSLGALPRGDGRDGARVVVALSPGHRNPLGAHAPHQEIP